MSHSPLRVSVIIPAYNEANNIIELIHKIQDILQDTAHEILVIDDGSDDESALLSESAGAKVIRHPYNIGNGAAIKTGIRNAQGEILVMLDADGQHPPEDIPRLLEKIGPYDVAVGARTSDSDTDFHRDFANQIYNILASYISGTKIDDLTSGFRALKMDVARGFVYLLPNRFSYPTTITLATLRSGRSLVYVPIKGRRRVGKSNIRLVNDGLRFLIIIMRIATIFSPLKIFIPASALMFITGFGYGLFKVLFLNTRYGPTSAMLMTVSVVIFMVGLVSEQIAQLRFERSEFFTQE
ncbi:MAG: glycosyltransferase family 2 protein [Anaerolineales bacterium]|nr:glycosyltransferase family 2 protein [Chloroflexota bacterium]MBL6983122.1 glycosyltransferase family 2 protein [Anaerolineales bacterium]